ncbi:MAG TPA: MBL fold metallo-hydrolase [Xanthobacteraceae bacterium]|nr:MBL fold metallo-hydrolase [Xanthobacteraceae bacterium]
MIHRHRIGDAHITGVIEYSGPTHDPAFLYPAVDKAARDAALKANTGWLAPHHYAPRIDRLIVTIQLWVVQAGGNVIIVDTGVGNRKVRAAAARMDRLNTLVLPWLESIGAGPAQVTHVVMTHLHTDHVGWNTVDEDGKWVPTFPKARYLFPKEEFDYWKAQYDKGDREVNQGSFVDSVLPILDAGLADFMDGKSEVAGCLAPEPVPGHAPGMLSFRIRSRGEEGLFTADVMHNAIQIAHPEWNDRYCVWPDKALQSRAAVLARAAERGALIMPMHLGYPYCGYVRRQGAGYAFEPAT